MSNCLLRLSKRSFHWPIFLGNENRITIAVNGDTFRTMITDFFVPALHGGDMNEVWFQKDFILCHNRFIALNLWWLFNYPKYIHTYITDHYNPSVRIIDLVSHATYVVCVNFIYKWRNLQFKVDSERQTFLRNFSWQFYLLSEFVPEICWEEIVEVIRFVFCFDVWPGARTLVFRLLIQYSTC